MEPGDYTVSETVKAGWVQTCPPTPGTYSVTLTDSPVIDRDFGNRGALSISGMKFNDLNGNGVKDAGEPGLPDWTINLTGPVSGTTTTAADGSYAFTNLKPGDYTVSEVLKPGWVQTCPTPPGTYSVTLTDTSATDKDFGNRGALSISGMKFNDLNGNGVKDAGEPGLPDWTINLAGPVSGTTATAADGSYSFTNLEPGDYTVSEVLKPGWVQTCPTPPGTYSVTLTDTSATDKDFGNRGAMSISGMKFNDLNGNGVKDAGEPGLPGWRIYNDSNSNGVFDPGERNVTTGAGGAYSFNNLEPGTYNICEVVKDGWAQTTTPTCHVITLTDTSSTGNDFGNRGVLSISLEKTGSPAIVAPGGNVTYTIKYKNTGTGPLHHVVITEHYPKGVTFISASPAPDAGTNNVWTIGTLLPGESGTIVIKVKVPEPIDLSFTETGSVIGEGVVMVTKDLSTEQKPYWLKNRVTLSCDELAPVSKYATTKVSGVPGTSLGITESGSGVYSSDENLDLETKNKSIILKKSTNAEYKPTSFNFSDGFSVNFTNKWKQDICSRNMEIDAAIHKKISDATYIDDETISRVDKDKSIMNFDSSFNGSMYIGARTKETEISETYIGEFDVLQTIHIAKGPIPTPAPTPTPTPIWLPCPYNVSQGNTTEDAEPTP
uniref:DUF11 domain-containing protein n=1 Tax=Candidatus Methanophaga sp. ANME-1 ERB7 TaxID=2759913 RepID=A0A7G9Z9R4_9EURY|nr:fibrinogen-binding protein-like [uncultured archaeon GZfos1D1]QNO56998.1 hypothetical protein MGAOFDBH_00016 [Methanosarcinales archaeon ANME-1 ERB7]